MTTICSPCYHFVSFVTIHVLVQMMYNYTLLVVMNKKDVQESKQGTQYKWLKITSCA